MHGAALVLLDGMGLGAGLSPCSVVRLRQACVKVLKGQVRAGWKPARWRYCIASPKLNERSAESEMKSTHRPMKIEDRIS